MAGFTGYTAPTNADAPEGPEQMEDIYEHFDPLIGETVTTASLLPASGNWVGRTVHVQDTESLYQWQSDSSWSVVGSTLATSTVTANGAGGWSNAASQVLAKRANRVSFQGAFTHASHTPGAAAVLLGTLPVGYRPPSRMSTAAVLYGSGQLASVDITSAGLVELNNFAGVTAVMAVEFVISFEAA